MATPEQVYEALRALPERERLRVIERVIRDLANKHSGADQSPGRSFIGLWGDEPEAVDEMVEGLMRARARRPLRLPDDQHVQERRQLR